MNGCDGNKNGLGRQKGMEGHREWCWLKQVLVKFSFYHFMCLIHADKSEQMVLSTNYLAK